MAIFKIPKKSKHFQNTPKNKTFSAMLEESRRVFFDTLYNLMGHSFKVKPFLFQARKILNLDFKDKTIIAIVSKRFLTFINYD